MILDLSEVLASIQRELPVLFLVFLRVGAMMAALPGLGEQLIPMRVRLSAAVCLSLLVHPLVRDAFLSTPDTTSWHLAAVEVAAGLTFGVFLRFFVHALQTAGTMAAQSVSLSQILGPTGADPVPALGQVLVIGGLALAFVAGLHIRIVEYLLHSYAIIGPGGAVDGAVLARRGVEVIAYTFGIAFSLAAPFVVASLVYNLALGAINRAMPQLMVAFVGAPAITAGGLILLAIAAPLMLSVWISAFRAFMAQPGGAL